ncbi:hypothetical protein B566_EDAN003837 [Ephemera danica]|nr:hypothetical protein B566_EDAN003837 [Ephemera danica]
MLNFFYVFLYIRHGSQDIFPLLYISTNELVLVNFYADWCRFSNLLAPVWDEAAKLIATEFPEAGQVILGKVDCDQEGAIATRYHITKYPTLKVFRNGQVTKREYRGQRSAEALLNYVKKQLEDPIKELKPGEKLEFLGPLCVPMVREITFENAEELSEEGLPFLILFHQNVNFLTADGEKFSHPLHHLGKSMNDLPLIAIDSFRHMYLFPKFEDMHVPGRVKQFLADLYSGKLHREFHYGPDSTVKNDGSSTPSATSPPESTFKKLAPSKNRYTLLRDEL